MPLFKNSTYSIGARWIFPMTGPALESHFVNVADGLIDSIATVPTKRPVYDFGEECVILPGTVNMHTHLELSGLDAPLDSPLFAWRRPMIDWIRCLIEFRRGPGYDARQAILGAMLRQDVLSETAALVDIAPPELDLCDEGMPDRPVYCRFPELIAWTEGQTEYRLGDQIALPPERRFGLSPHAPHTVCPALLGGAVWLARKENKPLAMHLAESPEEIEFLRTGRGPFTDMMRDIDPDYDPEKVRLGRRPLDYLKLLAEAPRAIVIHGNYLDDEELDFLAAHRETMCVVYCPRSHEYFGHDPYPLKKMLDKGVRVLLGTDSLASAPDLSIVEEMRFVLERHPEISPETVFRLGTLDGARELEVDAGTLEPGKPARFAFV